MIFYPLKLAIVSAGALSLVGQGTTVPSAIPQMIAEPIELLQRVDTLKVYDLAVRANNEVARPIALDALQISRKLVDEQHSLIIIDQELIVVGHDLGAFVANKNPTRDREVRLFTE